MAKRSRRARRQQAGKQRQNITRTPAAESTPSPVTPDNAPVSTQATEPASRLSVRKTLNFLQEYFYVYRELRNIFIIAIIMFAVLVGLSFVI